MFLVLERISIQCCNAIIKTIMVMANQNKHKCHKELMRTQGKSKRTATCGFGFPSDWLSEWREFSLDQ